MYYGNQQQQAPDHSRLQYQPIALSLGSPPFIPNVQCEAFLQPYLPVIVSGLILEIQNKAVISSPTMALRIFMFNQHAVNSYNNPDFTSLVQTAVDYVGLQIRKTGNQNIDFLLQTAIPQLVEMFCAINLRLFSHLENFIDRNAEPAIRMIISTLDNTLNEIVRLKSGYQQPQSMFPQQGYVQQGYSQNTSMFPQQNIPRPSVGGSQLFNTGNRTPVTNSMGGKQMSPGKYTQDNTVAAPNIQQLNIAPTPIPTAKQVMVGAEVLATETEWKPGKTYPYYPVYTPSKQVLYLKIEQDGSTTPLLREVSAVADMMNYEKHVATGIFGPIPRKLDLSNRTEIMKNINSGIKKINTELLQHNSTSKTGPQLPKVFVGTKQYIELSEANAWFYGSIDRLLANNGVPPDVFMIYSTIAEPVISSKDDGDYVSKLASSPGFLSLRDKMNVFCNNISSELWVACNKRATKMVNKILSQNMSLPGVSIDSFVDDIEELIVGIKDTYSEAIKDAFLKHQKEYIDANFRTVGTEFMKELETTFIGDVVFPEGHKPFITYLSTDCSFTFVEALSYELDIEFAPDIGSIVTPSNSPMLYSLLEGIFMDAAANNRTFDRHLIKTSDNRVLEASKGAIGEDALLISLID